MKTVQIEQPDALAENEAELKAFLAAKLYESGRLSLGEAASVAGKTKRECALELGKYGVSLFNAPPSELAQDMENA